MRAGVEWLVAQGLRVIGLLGHSKGGSGVVLYAAKYDDVPRVVNVSGRFDMKRGARLQPVTSQIATCISVFGCGFPRA